ncbi:MAG: ribosomal-processing cysteine protease Prp [Clostridia bacterium]|nr:ribosomal-processing cysteine protease Prp [Clostridia bacterium]MCR5690486.1 ribosomal-processing cysteine protease Prp [Clostridiales bacterium]
MIKAVFTEKQGRVFRAEIDGHAEFADPGKDVVCAAVSSACYMAVNTVTDVIRSDAKVSDDKKRGRMRCEIKDESPAARQVLEGLRLHLEQLALQYPGYITVTTEES